MFSEVILCLFANECWAEKKDEINVSSVGATLLKDQISRFSWICWSTINALNGMLSGFILIWEFNHIYKLSWQEKFNFERRTASTRKWNEIFTQIIKKICSLSKRWQEAHIRWQDLNSCLWAEAFARERVWNFNLIVESRWSQNELS